MHRARSEERRAQLVQDRGWDNIDLYMSAFPYEPELWPDFSPPCPSYSRLATMSVVRLRSMLYKEIYRRLSAKPATESVIADAISSSSTGNVLSLHIFVCNIGQLAKQPRA